MQLRWSWWFTAARPRRRSRGSSDLVVILDLFSRRVVGWKLGQTLESDQSLDAATEDRALRGRTLSAAAALQTAGRGRLRAAHRPQGRNLPEQAQSVKSQGVRGTESPDSFDHTVNNRELRVHFFGGSTC